jgi:hypothetical protein
MSSGEGRMAGFLGTSTRRWKWLDMTQKVRRRMRQNWAHSRRSAEEAVFF